ncbi:MAG: methyltransferase domain-containing protein [Candidatus Glassbacteria bacterium]
MPDYVHGYSQREAERLQDQAGAVRKYLLEDTGYEPGNLVLEAGCGVGAQTVTLAAWSPGARFVCVDIAEDSLVEARRKVAFAGLGNAGFQRADIFSLPFAASTFDHAFVCYVLEHLTDPAGALSSIIRTVRPDGTVTVIEGDHGSCYWYPVTAESIAVWNCLIRVQQAYGGNSLIGRELYPLLKHAGLAGVEVSPRLIYIDQSRPELKDSFVRKTIIAMVEGVEQPAKRMGLADDRLWKQGIEDLNRVADSPDGTFIYTFFKATGKVTEK